MLLTRFKIRRLRFAMTTVSHTDGNRATSQARGETGALTRPSRARVGTGGLARPAPDKPNIFAVQASLRPFRARASLPSCCGISY